MMGVKYTNKYFNKELLYKRFIKNIANETRNVLLNGLSNYK